MIHYTWADPLPGFALTMVVAILWLKLVSYAHVNWDYRCGAVWGSGVRGGVCGRGGGGRALALAVCCARQNSDD